jgi:LysR family transcriptional regulator, glycine cleavage system transcriptional activator
MGRKLPSLNALRTFEAAARNLSFSDAADELFVSQAAVSRQIRLLEEDLDVKLFRRLTRAVELTEEGASLYPPMRDALDQIERATARIWNKHGGSLLTISVLPTLSVKWLMPRLLNFSESHPNIEVHLVNSIKPVDFDRDEIDLAIRVGSTDVYSGSEKKPRIDLTMAKNWSGIQAELLMPDELIAVMSPKLAGAEFIVGEVEGLRGMTLLQMATRPNAWPDYLEAVGWPVEDARQGPSFGHFFMALQAAIEGKGIALLPYILAQDDLRDGRIVPAIPGTVRSAGDYYLIGRKSQWERQKVKIFRSWLHSQIAECVDPSSVYPQFHA